MFEQNSNMKQSVCTFTNGKDKIPPTEWNGSVVAAHARHFSVRDGRAKETLTTESMTYCPKYH